MLNIIFISKRENGTHFHVWIWDPSGTLIEGQCPLFPDIPHKFCPQQTKVRKQHQRAVRLLPKT